MSWAGRRQFQYLGGLLLFLALIGFAIAYPMLTKAPTCFDGVQNGGEAGVDCGGVCQRLCSSQVSEPIILWSRAFNVTGSVYNLVAFVENQNKNAGVQNMSYEFKIYNDKNLLLGTRQGTTFIPPNQQFAIFEPRFDSGQDQIKSVKFEFTGSFVWVKKDPTLQTLPLKVDNVTYGEDKSSPTLNARISNESIYDLPPFDIIAILYDVDHNAINASKTHREDLGSNTNVPLLFTWPQAFPENPVTQDILPQINPFSVSF